ncbi:hypothetical protein CWB96_00260 [Pseudoalteromonas citrea]|uniref:Uncharacterized protein n=1 Tax=Pseudoalteromonas citrea TaxID=43655 RepID=A0A5S3XX29_9GAMM|nr:hypothetical protein [Pseudoalteromonas citrea]TMP46299.1 hypothetical protein CWB97_02255 [Pseudoalteromonas citrea]TMP63075.1 hypothetical protein CWB96_00260 [Pseudoalteromonas citrea]
MARKLKSHQRILIADTVQQAKLWLEDNDPNYLARYEGHCYLLCEQPAAWQERVNSPKPVKSNLMKEANLSFHLLAEIGAGTITNTEDITQWFDRSLAKIQVSVDETTITKVFDDLKKSQMIVVSENGSYKISKLGGVSVKWYYRPEDIFFWSCALQTIEQLNLWDNDDVLAWGLAGAPSYNLDYIPKNQVKLVDEYAERLRGHIPFALGLGLPADIAEHIRGKAIPYQRLAAFKHDLSRVFQALREVAEAHNIKRPKGFWHLLETRFKEGVASAAVELMNVEGMGVVALRKLARQGITSLEHFIDYDNESSVFDVMGHKKAPISLVSAKSLVRAKHQK